MLSAVLPTVLVGTTSYWTARATLTEKLSDQLNSRASLTAARVAEWYQERRNDARIFAGSSMVVGRFEGRVTDPAKTRAYLEEVRGRYGFYRALVVVDRDGKPVASVGTPSSEGLALVASPPGGSVAALAWDESGPILWLSSPILGDGGDMLGRFVMACDFEALGAALDDEEGESAERLRLSGTGGRLLFSHPAEVDADDFLDDLPEKGGLTELRDGRGVAVLAAARDVTIPELDEPLSLTVTTDAKDAFAAVTELGQRILLLSALVVVLVVGLGYALVRSLTDPLERLAIRAQAVAHGDYASDLPVRSPDEIGYLTEVFNGMTANLKASHERLERLSVTDELTQLVNRRELRRVLERELVQSLRTGRALSLILLDIDHFKAFNDEHGHLRGDELLTRLGAYLREELPDEAVAARYGGEEFLVLLPGVPLEEATTTAERVRTGFSEALRPDSVTLSLGVSASSDALKTPTKLIDAADQALYRAKREGRNRVVVANGEPGEDTRASETTGEAKDESQGKDKNKGRPKVKKARAPRKKSTSSVAS